MEKEEQANPNNKYDKVLPFKLQEEEEEKNTIQPQNKF